MTFARSLPPFFATFAMVVALALAGACGDEEMVAAQAESTNRPTLTRVGTDHDALVEELRAVAAKKVWFGHHSVGVDMLEGVQALARSADVQVAIGEGPVGENGKPLDKIADFEREAIEGAGKDADVVAMKLCYADFTPTTNVAQLVDAYAQSVQRIRAARPGVRVLHITAPLTTRQEDFKSRVMRFLGRPVWGDEANLRRLEYAEALQARFPGEPVLDLARVQSTRKDGGREMHLVSGNAVPGGRGRLVPMLWSGWSRDEGHLNDEGKRIAGRAFVGALAAAVKETLP